MVESQTFALYGTTWAAYLAAGAVLLLLVYWGLRNRSFWIKMPVITMLMAGAFTVASVPDSDTLAPAAIAMILALEDQGLSGFLSQFINIAVVWLVLMLATSGIRMLLQSRAKEASLSKPKADSANGPAESNV